MGLDMYVELISKPDKTVAELAKHTREELLHMGYSVCDETRLPDDFDNIRDVTVEFETEAAFVDWEKIKAAAGAPEDAEIAWTEYSPESLERPSKVVYKDQADKKYVVQIEPEDGKKYQYTKRVTAYCFVMKTIAYWRKNYDLSSAIHSACDEPVRNCGLYPMNAMLLEAVAEHDRDAYENIMKYIDDENSLVAYYEWY